MKMTMRVKLAVSFCQSFLTFCLMMSYTRDKLITSFAYAVVLALHGGNIEFAPQNLLLFMKVTHFFRYPADGGNKVY